MTALLGDATLAALEATLPVLEAEAARLAMLVEARTSSAGTAKHTDARWLTGTLFAWVHVLGVSETADEMLDHIATRHVATQVQPEDYAPVGDVLLGAIAEVLGEEAEAAATAWAETYWLMAGLLIGRESSLYRQQTG